MSRVHRATAIDGTLDDVSTRRISPSAIAYDREGPRTGPTVVLIHAGIADRRMWDAQWGDLVAVHDCLRMDLRGFGESLRPPEGELSHVDDILELLGAEGVERCHLVGASLGAGVAVELTLTAPTLAESLLLCPPGGALLTERTPDLDAFVTAESAALEGGDLDGAVQADLEYWVIGPGRVADAVDPLVLDEVAAMQRLAFEIQLAWDPEPSE